MNLVILGPQGSGKGTQAELLVKKYSLNYVEMGNILRSVANSDNQYAPIVKKYQLAGKLVPDEYVRLIAWDHINKQDKNKGFLFDGYPRSLAQYDHLEDMLRRFGKKLDVVIDIEISDAEAIRRLSARRTCEKCKEIYNLITKPPQNQEICDKCGGKLLTRSDDQPEAIQQRLDDFHANTQHVLNKAKEEGLLVTINGEQPIEKIHQEIVKKLIP